jgi:aldehyde dehydrogenase (NAD+)
MTTVAEIFETMDYGPAPESDAEARAWLARHDGRFGHFVNGAFTKAGTTFDVIDPSTSKGLAKVTQGSAKDVDAAVAAARKAYPKWQKLGAHGRARHLYALARMVQKHSRLLAVIESMDNG